MRPLLIFLIVAALLISTALFASAQDFEGPGFGFGLPSDVLRAPVEPPELLGYASAESALGVHLLFKHFRPRRRLIAQPFLTRLPDSSRPKMIYALPQRSRIRQTVRHHRGRR